MSYLLLDVSHVHYPSSTPVSLANPVRHERLHPDQGWIIVDNEDIAHYKDKGQEIRPLFAADPAPGPFNLVWQERTDPIFGQEYFTYVIGLENSVGPAGFTIRTPTGYDAGFRVTWWHGNHGYQLPSSATLDDAKQDAVKHLEFIVQSLIRSLVGKG